MANRISIPRLGGAIRFAATIAIVNLSSLALFGAGPAPTFASFAVVASLYFLDYDGSIGERFRAFTLSTFIGVLGIGIGLVVSEQLWSICLAALFIGFAFAAARAFRGFIARSFVGTQLAFVLTVITHDPRAHGTEIALAWLYGSAIALVAAIVLFPRYHSGVIRRGLATWSRAAARVATGAPVSELTAAWNELVQVDRGHSIAGLWSRRTRALAEMVRAAEQLTVFISTHALPKNPSTADALLLKRVAEAFDEAADRVSGGTPTQLSLAKARQDHERTLHSSALHQSSEQTVDEAQQSLPARVLSLAAQAMCQLSSESITGKRSNAATVNPAESSRISERIRSLFRGDSIWFRNGIRTGFALALAIGIAISLGLEHGVWVVMATLALINVTATTRGTAATALTTLTAVVIGVVISAGILALHQPWVVMFVLLAVAAFAAKWLLSGTVFWAQLSYSPFAVLNVVVLSWPTPHGLDAVRIEDIAVGVAVGVFATAFAFPFGMAKLLDRTWRRARETANSSIAAIANAFNRGEIAPVERLAALREAVDLLADEVDAVSCGDSATVLHNQIELNRSQWLLLAEFCATAISHFASARVGRPLPQTLWTDIQPLNLSANVTRVAKIRSNAEGVDPEALILTTWAAEGMDILGHNLASTETS